MFGSGPVADAGGHYEPALAGWSDPSRSGSQSLGYNDSRAIIAAAQAAAAAGKPPKRLPTSAIKPSGRTRPTNNQLLYKAYFRWEHYVHKIYSGPTLPDETEACASVTSAFLQVLSTLHAVEARRVDKPRNILQILSTNTRRTKVVELSSGTHRVADELRRHSLSDGDGGQYSTNLDRNRYGNDDQYLSTVIRYDLEFLDLCPCLVDVEIIDAKAGNESTLVSAGPDMCTCQDAPRKQSAPIREVTKEEVTQLPSGGMGVSGAGGGAAAAAAKAWPAVSGERAASGRLYTAHPTGSRGTANASGGSDLFDALLMAATGGTETERAPSVGEPPVTSKMVGSQGTVPGMARQRSRLWATPASMGEVDSLQNALEAWKADEEIASGAPALDSPFRRVPSRRRFPRKTSYSNFNVIDDAPPTGETLAGGSMHGGSGVLVGGASPGNGVGKERSGENGPEASVRSGEGDTEAAQGRRRGGEEDDEELEMEQLRREASGGARGLARGVHRQSSAVNLAALSRLGKDAEIKRLADECRSLQQECKALECEADESRAKEAAAVSKLQALQAEADRAAQQGQAYLDQVTSLRAELHALRGMGRVDDAAKRTSSDAGTGQDAGESERTRSEGDESLKNSDPEVLRRELKLARSTIQRLENDKRALELKLNGMQHMALSPEAAAMLHPTAHGGGAATLPAYFAPSAALLKVAGLDAYGPAVSTAAAAGAALTPGAAAPPVGLSSVATAHSSQPCATALTDVGAREAEPEPGATVASGSKRKADGAADGGAAPKKGHASPEAGGARGQALGLVNGTCGSDKEEEVAGLSGKACGGGGCGSGANAGGGKPVSPNRSSHSSSPEAAAAHGGSGTAAQ